MAEVALSSSIAFEGIDEQEDDEAPGAVSKQADPVPTSPEGKTAPPKGAPLKFIPPDELETAPLRAQPAPPSPAGRASVASPKKVVRSPSDRADPQTPSTRMTGTPSSGGTPAVATKVALPRIAKKMSDVGSGPLTPRVVSAAAGTPVRKRNSGQTSLTATLPPVNARINFKVHSMDYSGKVTFAGLTEFAEGHWVGVVMDTRDGKHDGVVKGKRYFTCAEGHGLFIRPQMITKVFGNLESLDRDLMPYDSVSCVSGITDTTVSFCSAMQSELVDELRSEVSSLRQLNAEQTRKAEEMSAQAQAIAKTAEEQLAESARASREAMEEVKRLREEVEYERRCRLAEEAERRRLEQAPRPTTWWDTFMSAFVATACCSRPLR